MAYFDRTMIFKASYKITRRNTNLTSRDRNPIFLDNNNKATPSLYTLTDYSEFYLSEESLNNKTILSQPIAEGITLLTKILASYEDSIFTINNEGTIFNSKLYVPKSFKINKIFPENVEYFKTEIDFDRNVIKTAAYDNQNSILPIIDGDNTTTFIDCENKNFHFHDYNMMIPIFATFSRIKMEYDLSYRKNYETFMKSENEDTTKTNYIRLCEDLYQENKDLTIQTIYCNNSENIEMEKNIIASLSGQNPDKNIKQERESSFNVPEVTIFNDSDFQPDQLEYIPNLPPEFEMPEDLIGLSKALYTGDVKSVLFHGPAGTGKTANCKLLCQQINMPIMEIINCSEAMDETILGKFIPYDDKIVFKESKIIDAIKYGGTIVFEEINFAKPQHLAFLNSLLDDNGFVILDNGDKIKRHQNFRFMATMNYGYAGTRELNSATYNRFNYVYYVPDLPVPAIKKMLLKRVPDCQPQLSKIISIYEKVKTFLQNQDMSNGHISARNLENWARAARYEGYLKAAEHTIVTCAEFDEDLEKAIRRLIKMYFN